MTLSFTKIQTAISKSFSVKALSIFVSSLKTCGFNAFFTSVKSTLKGFLAIIFVGDSIEVIV